MSNPLFLPLKVFGWAFGAAVAAAGGWKLGCYLAEVVTGEREPPWSCFEAGPPREDEEPEPLWKRKFSPVSER